MIFDKLELSIQNAVGKFQDRVLFEKEQALAETQMRYRLLEERTLETQANGAVGLRLFGKWRF